MYEYIYIYDMFEVLTVRGVTVLALQLYGCCCCAVRLLLVNALDMWALSPHIIQEDQLR